MPVCLPVPYKSQYDADAALSRNDCGPTCLAMLLAALGHTASTDDVFTCTGAPADGYVSMAQLIHAAERFAAPLEFHQGCDLHELHIWLDQGRPFIALVHYGAFSAVEPGVSTQSSFAGPHFVLVVGYDTDSVTVHDPLWTGERRAEGAFRRWPAAIFMQAWTRCHEDGNPDGAALVPGPGLRSHARVRHSRAYPHARADY